MPAFSLLLSHDAWDQRDRNSSIPICSGGDSVMETLPVRPLSAPAPLDHIREESWSSASPDGTYAELSADDGPTYQNALAHSVYQQNSKVKHSNK